MGTKEILIQSIITVLNEDPSSSLDVIAKKANVSRRTLHRYFTSREAMIKICIGNIIENMFTDVNNAIRTNTSPLDQLKKMFEDDIAKGQHFEFCQKFAGEYADDELQLQFKKMGDMFYEVLDMLKSEKLIDPQLSNDWLSYVWMGMVRSTNQALKEGVIAPKTANNLGWNAFIKGVLIQKTNIKRKNEVKQK